MYGVRPLFKTKENFTLCSELKGLPSVGTQITPGVYYSYNLDTKQISEIPFINKILNP
jgi:hypothetical protein